MEEKTFDYQFSDVLSVYHRKQSALRGIIESQQIFEEDQRKQIDKIEHLVTVLIQNETSKELQNMLDTQVKNSKILARIKPYDTYFHVLKVAIMGCLMKEYAFSESPYFVFPGSYKEGEILFKSFQDDINKIEKHLGVVFVDLPYAKDQGFAIRF